MCPLHLHHITTLPWEILICGFGTILANNALSIELLNQLKNLGYSTTNEKFAYYCDAREAVIHWCHCRRDADIFQQESAPAHYAHQTVELLQCETSKFIGPELWMPNSPDLILANYHIWSVLQDSVYQPQIKDVADLTQCLVDTWSGFSQSIVDNA